jgi:hypothetical protein
MSVNDNRSNALTHSLPRRSRSGTIHMTGGRHDPDRSLLINY